MRKTTIKIKQIIQNNIKDRNIIDINITQLMVGKQCVESWGMYRWAGEASTQVKEASNIRVMRLRSMHFAQHFIIKIS